MTNDSNRKKNISNNIDNYKSDSNKICKQKY